MLKDRVELKIYQDALNGFLVDNLEKKQYIQLLAKYYLPFFADVHKAWNLQRELGQFPEGMTEEELDSQALSRPGLKKNPYTALRWDEHGQLMEVAYRDIPDFGKVLDSAGGYLRKARGFIEHPEPEQPFSEKNALIDNLLALDPAFPGGDFEPSRYALLNREVYPRLVIDAGLSDPYGPYKYNFQGWLMSQDPVQTQTLNLELIMALSNMREFLPDQQEGIDQLPGHRLLAGDVIVHAGLAALEEWRGNTMPSENNLRLGRRTTTYIFLNTLRERFYSYILPSLRTYLPNEFRDNPEWIEKAYLGTVRFLSGHEGLGHRLANVGSPETVGGTYMTFKESQSDVFSQIGNMRSNTVPLDERRILLASALGWRRADIAAFNPETQKGKAHTIGGMMWINALHEGDVIEINQRDGSISDINIQKLDEVEVKYVNELTDVTTQGANNPRFNAEYVDYRANYPVRYLQPDGGSPGDYPSSQRLAA